jgi:hypothetical protein
MNMSRDINEIRWALAILVAIGAFICLAYLLDYLLGI